MESIINYITTLLTNLGPIAGFIIIVIESMIPILPLAAFITLNVISFGNIIGFIISYLATIVGCILMFFLCRKLNERMFNKYKKNKKVMNFRDKISSISFSNLVLLFAIPFTPAFLVNIAGGLSDVSSKKYSFALLIGKIPMVYFWCFIGKSLVESLTDISTLVRLCTMILLAFLVSKVANKYLKI